MVKIMISKITVARKLIVKPNKNNTQITVYETEDSKAKVEVLFGDEKSNM